MCVHMCMMFSSWAHMFILSRVMCASRLKFIYASLVDHSPDHWRKTNLSLSPPDDFAHRSDCLSLPRQAASSSSNHHNNASHPLMTHWAELHNSHSHIASAPMCVCVCAGRCMRAVEFKHRFFNYFQLAHLRKWWISAYTSRHTEPSLLTPLPLPPNYFLIPLVLLL